MREKRGRKIVRSERVIERESEIKGKLKRLYKESWKRKEKGEMK